MIKDGLVDIDDISVLKEAEKCASKLCCTDCKAVICEEKCECWNFAKKGAEFGYNKAGAEAKDLIEEWKRKTECLEKQIEAMKCCGNCENGELSAHEEPCLHCKRCFASNDAKDQENVKDNWEAIKEIEEK